MNQFVLLIALFAALVTILVLVARHSASRVKYCFSQEDLDKNRKQAIQGSRLTKGGQVADQLAPLLPAFYERFNPKDARFLGGGPIDFVIFDGLDDGDVRQVVFIDVKTGSNELNSRQRQVRRAVREGRVNFDVLKLPRTSSVLSKEELLGG